MAFLFKENHVTISDIFLAFYTNTGEDPSYITWLDDKLHTDHRKYASWFLKCENIQWIESYAVSKYLKIYQNA